MRVLETDARRPLMVVIEQVVREAYLPLVPTPIWVVRAGRHGRPLAVMATRWKWPKLVVDSDTEIGSVGEALHFEYISRGDPSKVFDQLSGTGSLPDSGV